MIAKNKKSRIVFYGGGNYPLGGIRPSHHIVVFHFRKARIPYARRVARRRDGSHLLREGKSRGSGAHDIVQRDVRRDIVHLRVLRGDDDLPRHVRADGGLFAGVVAPQSV